MVELKDLRLAHRRLEGTVAHTPLVLYPRSVSKRLLYFKPESFQPVESFKLRGAYNKLASLSEEERGRGMIAILAATTPKAWRTRPASSG